MWVAHRFVHYNSRNLKWLGFGGESIERCEFHTGRFIVVITRRATIHSGVKISSISGNREMLPICQPYRTLCNKQITFIFMRKKGLIHQ